MKLQRTCWFALLCGSVLAPRIDAQMCPRTGTLQHNLTYDDTADPFNGIRDVVGHADGRVLVSESDGTTLKLFDAAGKFVRSIGRAGEGPGEFRSIANLRITGDSLWVFDDRLRRGTYLRLDGSVGATINFRTPLPRGQAYGNVQPFGNGFFVLPALPPLNEVMPEAVYRELYVLDPRTERVSTIAPPLRMRAFITRMSLPDRGSISLQHPTPTIDRLSFSRQSASIMIARGDVGSDGTRAVRLTRIAGNGDTLFHRRLEVGPAPVESAFLESEMTRALGIYSRFFPSEAAARRAISSAWQVEKHYPPVSGFTLDGQGRIWIRTSPARNHWLVLTEQAAPFGCVEAPLEVRLVGARDQTMWGVSTDAAGVQSLRRYTLTFR